MGSESGDEVTWTLEATGVGNMQQFVIADAEEFASLVQLNLSNQGRCADAKFLFAALQQ